jgi:hypothetical protein
MAERQERAMAIDPQRWGVDSNLGDTPPSASPTPEGVAKPRQMAVVCRSCTALATVGGALGFIFVSAQDTDGVHPWGLAIVVLAWSLTSAVFWYGGSVFFDWLADRFAQTERLARPK